MKTEDVIEMTIAVLADAARRADEIQCPDHAAEIREGIELVKRVAAILAPSTDDDIEEAADWVDGLRNNPVDCNGPPPWVDSVVRRIRRIPELEAKLAANETDLYEMQSSLDAEKIQRKRLQEETERLREDRDRWRDKFYEVAERLERP